MFAWNLTLVASCSASALVHLGAARSFGTVCRLALSTSVLVSLLYLITAYWQSAIRYSVEDTRKKSEMQAVRKLLDACCDAIVELDGSLALTQHSPKLAAVFQRNGGRSLKGQGLDLFMSTEDQRRYHHVMRQPPSKEMPCSARAIHFSAHGFNHGARIEIFSVPFEELDKSIHHLVGVREFDDVSFAVSEMDVMGEACEMMESLSRGEELHSHNQHCSCSILEGCGHGLQVKLPNSGAVTV